MSAPEIRFPEFKAPWRPTVAGVAFKHSRARGQAGLPIYSVTLDRGMVRRDSLDRHMESDAADGQNLRAQHGDIVYNMMRMWQGAVGVAPEECMVSPAYVVLRPTKETNPQFFNYWFQTSRMLHKLGAYSHGLTKDRLRLYPDDFAKIPLHLPTRAEQDRIAAFFEDIDAKLTALREKADWLRQFKTGLMQRLFSQELRFTRDDGSDFPDWEERKLRDFIETVRGLSYSSGDVSNEGVAVLRSNNIRNGRLDMNDIVLVDVDPTKVNFVDEGDILLCANNGSRNLIGKTAIMTPYAVGMAHGAFMMILRGPENLFVFQLLQTDKFRSIVYKNLGAVINSINASDLKSFSFNVPSDKDERAKIADALIALDTKIDAVTYQITHMETFKKGLLQKMFV
jgi:type I restriction enzyme S subunit